MIVPPPCRRIFAVLLAACCLRGQGDVGDLTCRVATAVVACPGSVLLEVEVRNRGRLTAVPTVFVVEDKGGGLQVMERSPLPHAGRRGRGVAGQGLQRYRLQAATTAPPRSLSVRVEAAWFHDGAPDETAPVVVGALRQGLVEDGGRALDATFVTLRNTALRPIDAILLATYERPEKGQGLLAVRLAAGADGEVPFSRRPLALRGVDADLHVAISKVELVDWTWVDPTVGSADFEPADLLRVPYEAWRRWEMPWPSGEGQLVARYGKSSRLGGEPVVVEGRFALKDVAPPLLEIPGNTDLEARRAIEIAVERAFGDLRRRSWSELAKDNTIERIDTETVRLDGHGWEGLHGRLVQVRDGVITGTADADAPLARFQRWLVERRDGGYLPVARDTFALEVARLPGTMERWVYSALGQTVVPLRYRRVSQAAEHREFVEVTLLLEGLRFRGAAAPKAPAGPGAAALAEAWRGGYRYPDQPGVLRARFDLRPAGDDPIWAGERRVQGDLRIDGFVGFRPDGRALLRPEIGVAHKRLDEAQRQQLAAGVHDRLLLWASRDFAGRAPFAEQFADAIVLGTERPGVFEIGRHPIREAEVQDGRVVRLTWRSGHEVRIDWRQVRDVAVPARIIDGAATMTVTYKRLDARWTVPEVIQLEGLAAGPDGPRDQETLRFTRPTVE